MEYAIVDIETTGGNAFGSRITEIAIFIHNGKEVIDSFESLVNPEMEIPPPIFSLTGINNEMVKHAPIFEEIAEQVFCLLENRVFVAHNVNFDYSFIHHQLAACGYAWNANKLCTVRLSRKLRPGLPSYSLGALCTYLDIPIAHRHRAGGDAAATAILFQKLLDWDENNHIPVMLKKNAKEQVLPPNLSPADFENLPNCTGIYYFHNQANKVIYVGKALNIKKRVGQHFSGNNIFPQRQNFLRDIYSISFEPTGTELIALIKEYIEIKKYWPKYNRALKKYEAQYGLFSYQGMDGFTYLNVGKTNNQMQAIIGFNKLIEAQQFLRQCITTYDLDVRFCNFGLQKSSHAEQALPDVNDYNLKVHEALQNIAQISAEKVIIDKGRDADEQSFVWINNENIQAFGFLSKDFEYSDFSAIKSYLEPCPSSFYLTQLIRSFMEREPSKVKTIHLQSADTNSF